MGRKSVFGGVGFGMGEKELPAPVAAEGRQTHQGLIAGLTPKLSDPFETGLVWSAG
jgi:hypothetical protein